MWNMYMEKVKHILFIDPMQEASCLVMYTKM